jgi:hypothetical protein
VFERLTVDMVANQLFAQFIEGEPSPRLAYRFFRKGRRDGKRALDPASIATLLRNSVGLAGSRLAEEYVVERRELEARFLGLTRATDEYERSSQDQRMDPLERIAALPGDTPDAGQTDGRRSDRALTHALLERRRLRAIADAQAAEQIRHEQQHRAFSASAEATQARTLMATLPERYFERFGGVCNTGALLWSRYCNGWEQGEARRGSRLSDVPAPNGSLEFQIPGAFAQRGLVNAGGANVSNEGEE